MVNCYKEQSCIDKNIYLIPGEELIKSSILNNYRLVMTNYRLYLICRYDDIQISLDRSCHIGIPLNLILKVEQVDFKHLSLWTKIGSVYKLSFDSSENCNNWLKSISESLNIKHSNKVFAFTFFKNLEKSKSLKYLLNIQSNKNKSKLNDFKLTKNEFKRMKFSKDSWKITSVNFKFLVCNSYPRYHIVPHSITDEDIKAMADFRGNKRFPSVVWRSQKNGAVIIRCAQPQVGLMFWRNSSDETFFKEVLNCLKPNIKKNRLLIIDARHYSTAQLNRIRGGGVEYSEYYGEAEIVFMQLENIHSVRSSFDCISMFSMNGENWLTSIENSYWLKYLSKLLKSSCDIAKALHEDGRSVIIHCSDGWDRTSQLTSLSQVLLDEYYRTVEGFKVLIEREWIHFGHKFSDRCGFYKSVDNKEWSPIFVQWLDCIHQLIRQYPGFFEFNETFLIKLALHVYSGLFGNFMFNTEEERQNNEIYSSTACIWNFLSESNEDIINPLYYKFSVSEPNYDFYKKVIYPKYTTKFLYPWNRLFFEALNPADIYTIFSLDHSSKSLNNFLKGENEELHENNITNNALSDRICFLRKFKSDSDLSQKFKPFLNSLEKSKRDCSIINSSIIDSEMVKCNGRFINQSSSTSILNDSNNNGLINENNSQIPNDDDHKSMKKNRFQPIELMAYCNGTNNYDNISNIKKFTKCELKGNLNESENYCDPSINLAKINLQENHYFRLKNLDDLKEIGISRESVPCDIDGLYKSVEPINMLAKFWKQKFEEQQCLINQMKEKLLLKSEQLNKIRYDSTSSGERGRNEDSLSSYDSYIMLEPIDNLNNHSENSKIENHQNIFPAQNSNLKPGNMLHFPESCNYNKSVYGSSFLRKSICNQQSYYPCDSGNGSEKAQA